MSATGSPYSEDASLAERLRDAAERLSTQATGLAVLAIIVAIVLALATWSVQDPSLSHATTAPLVLVGLNVLVYRVEIAQGGGLGVGSAAIIYDWGLFGPAVADGEWYRIVTSGFLHGGLIHLGFNMYLLWILGGALERYAGTGRMLAIYFSALLWGSALVLVITPNSLTIGASGAVFGLMAAMLLLERQRGIALLGAPHLAVAALLPPRCCLWTP